MVDDIIDLYYCLDGTWRPLSGMSEEDIKNNPNIEEDTFSYEDFVRLFDEAIGTAASSKKTGKQEWTPTYHVDPSWKEDATGFKFAGFSTFMDDYSEEIRKKIEDIIRRSMSS